MEMQPGAIGVLLIEDNPGDARLIRELLIEEDRHKFLVTSENRLSAAFDRLSESPFEVVLLDLGLPDSSGLDTYYRLKQAFPAVPVVVLSGLDDAETALKAVRSGAQDYLVKGRIDGGTLSRAIRYAIERTRVDAALQRQTNILSAVLHSIADGIVVTDVDGNSLIANQQALDILAAQEPLVNVTLWGDRYGLTKSCGAYENKDENFSCKDLVQCTQEAEFGFELAPSNEHGPRYIRLSVYPLKGGPDVETKGCVLVLRDETKKHTEEMEQLRLATALQQTANPVMITDPNGAIVYVNAAFVETTEFAEQEVLGKNPRMLKSGRMDSKTYKDMWNGISAGKVWQGRFINKSKSGKIVEVDCTVTPVRNARGTIVNYVATQRDVTNEVALENQLRHLQRMDAFGQLTSGIAHDFNNILTTINGYAELVLADLDDGHPLKEDVIQIQKAGKSAANLTRQLLAFSRQQVLRPELLDLNVIVGDMQRMLKRVVPEHIQLATDLSRSVHPVWADAAQIEQVILNLVVNACDAMPDGGSLQIRTENAYLDKAYVDSHFETEVGEYVQLTVSDTGTGMDQATQARIFEPFFTTKEVGKGTGLGLATVYGIVKQSGGTVWVYSEEGFGTTFKVYFPRAQAGGVPVAYVPEFMPPETLQGSETVLVVEDNDSVRQYIRRALTTYGYKVLEARDGEEAINLLAMSNQSVNIVLSDVVMPAVSGPDFAQRMQELMLDQRIVFMSGYFEQSMFNDKIRAYSSGFIEKPFTAIQLLSTIRGVLERE
ncbi:MAG: hypothetical protein AMXMBFR84_23300 [Candidatus Hydrogenedentota bacterium]